MVCSTGHLEVVELLIAHKCNMNLVNIDGDTALHMAMDEKRDQVAKVTLSVGDTEWHPNLTLHFIQVLLENGADPNIENDDGDKPGAS